MTDLVLVGPVFAGVDGALEGDLRAALEHAGYHIVFWLDGAQALVHALAQPPDLLVTDLDMAGLDGLELCRRWSTYPLLRAVPVVVCTQTQVDRTDRQKLRDLGVDDILSGPLVPGHVITAVQTALQHDTEEYSVAGAHGADSSSEPNLLRRQNQRLVAQLNARLHQLKSANQMLAESVEAHRKVELELRASESRFRLLAENARDMVYRLNLSPKVAFEYVSPSALAITGYSPQEFYEDPSLAHRLVHPDDWSVMRDVMTSGDASKPIVLRWICKGGRVIWTERRAHLLRGGEGQIIGIESMVRDITERREQEDARRELQAQLIEAQKMEALGTLAGGVAHDFNNQLMIISSYTEFVAESLSVDDPLHEEIQTVLAAAKRSASLTRQLLAFSRRQVVLPRRVDPLETLTNLHRMLRRMIGEDIQLEIVAPQANGDAKGSMPKVFIDPGQFEQVLINLAVNARDAMPDGGRLVFEIDPDRRHAGPGANAQEHLIAIDVRDTGQGMDAATLARIFEPFFTTKEAGRGTGLGLATAYGVIHQAQGEILVRSTPGVGTCFTILLPWATADQRDYAEAPAATRSSLDGTETLMVVDDEAGIRAIVKRALSRRGYTVLTAANAGEALLHAERHAGPIDLVLTDIVMPLMNGLELSRRLAAHRPDAQVILMTGFADHDLLRQALPEQPHPLMHKPFTPTELAARIRATLDAKDAKGPAGGSERVGS